MCQYWIKTLIRHWHPFARQNLQNLRSHLIIRSCLDHLSRFHSILDSYLHSHCLFLHHLIHFNCRWFLRFDHRCSPFGSSHLSIVLGYSPPHSCFLDLLTNSFRLYHLNCLVFVHWCRVLNPSLYRSRSRLQLAPSFPGWRRLLCFLDFHSLQLMLYPDWTRSWETNRYLWCWPVHFRVVCRFITINLPDHQQMHDATKESRVAEQDKSGNSNKAHTSSRIQKFKGTFFLLSSSSNLRNLLDGHRQLDELFDLQLKELSSLLVQMTYGAAMIDPHR